MQGNLAIYVNAEKLSKELMSSFKVALKDEVSKLHWTFAKKTNTPFTPQEPLNIYAVERTIQLVHYQFVVTDKYRYYSYLGYPVLPTKT